MSKRILVALLCMGLHSANNWAVMPLSEKQLKTVCMAFAVNKRAIEGQMCGHYLLGFLDGDIVGGDPRRICVPDAVSLSDVMSYVVGQIENAEVSETAPARDQVIPLLAGKWPCAAPASSSTAPPVAAATGGDDQDEVDPGEGGTAQAEE